MASPALRPTHHGKWHEQENCPDESKLGKKSKLQFSSMKKWVQIIEKKLLPPTPGLSQIQQNVGEELEHTTITSLLNRFDHSTTNLPTTVLTGLYVGNYRDSKDHVQLERHGITHIIAIHDAARKLHHDKHYLCVMASDSPDQNLSQYFSICNDFIHAARLRGGNVLIHCLAGMSRSVTVAVAYIMSVTDLSWKDALRVVRVGRTVANPNLGFQKQLQEFETCRLAEERRRLKERYPSLALIDSDQEQCRISLLNFETMLQAKDICEGNCPTGESCPTGLCRAPASRRPPRRKPSTTSLRTSPTPRMLPPTPRPSGGSDLTRSNASLNSICSTPERRPGSGPAGFHSYTGKSYAMATSTPLRADVAELPPGVSMNDLRKRRGNSAPGTPFVTPPASPQHWPRRASTLTKKPISAQKSSFN